MSEIFAKRLKEEREAKRWSQKYLAERLGLTNGAISGYERNYREPDILTLSRIAELLNVSAAYLIGESNQRSRVEKPVIPDPGVVLSLPEISAEEAEAIALIRKEWPSLSPAQRQKRLEFLKGLTKLTDELIEGMVEEGKGDKQ